MSSLKFLLVIPILSIIFFSGLSIREKITELTEIEKLDRLSSLSIKLSQLTHEVQKERGRTSGFMGSNGDEFSKELIFQRKATDAKITQVKEFLLDFDDDKYGLEVKAEFNASMQNLAEIEAHRKKVDEKSIAYTDALGYYSNVISEMITSLSHISKTSSDPQMVLLLSAYIDFLKAKEMMGIERAIGTNTISEDNFGPGLYVYFVSVVSAQEVYLDSYKQKVSKEQLSYLNNKLANPVVDETLEIRKNLIENGSVGGFGISAPDWFDLMTKKIDLLKEIEERLYTDIAKKSMVLKSDAKFELYAVIFTSLLSILVLVICILVWR